MRNCKSSQTSLIDSIDKTVSLFEAASIFPTAMYNPCKMTGNLSWSIMKRPTNVGVFNDTENEGRNRSIREQHVFDRSCKNYDDDK